MNMDLPHWGLTTEQVAVELGVSRGTVSHLCRIDSVPGARKHGDHWMIPVSSVELIPVRKRGRPRKPKPETPTE